ncbi:protein FAM177A1-like [Takifugu rubripes]|uniref:Protein FAM177A1-like n=1 Tax=Takifugu rubripes TaxID=31033 RepID=A0A674PLV4_TAKRU|nr:protein FAM177A1-like [Takifugu rubripes]
MTNIHQETCADIQETEFGDCAVTKQRRIIYFSSGETLEEKDSEEEEDQPSDSPFRESEQKPRFSFKKLVILVGRVSLLTCDFLGERLAAALGLNAAKYQYAIDLYDHNQKTTSSQAMDSLRRTQTKMIQLSSGPDKTHYGTSGNVTHPVDSQKNTNGRHTEGNEGVQNRGYQADDDYLK